MAVTVREIEEGEDLLIATVNDTLTEWTGEVVGAAHVREEGLHQRVFVQNIVREAGDSIDTGTATTINGGSAAAVINDGSDDMVIGPFNYSTSNDESIIVRASLYYAMVTTAVEFTVDIRYGSSSAGPWTVMNRSARTLAMRTGGAVGTGSLTIAARYDGVTNGTLWFALFAVSGPTGADDTVVDSINFFAENIAR
jgi:hypothetical protein